MSREHKYKAYDKTTKVMAKLIGFKYLKDMIELWYWNKENEEAYCIADKNDIELLEYTGLKDRIVRKDNSESKGIYRCDIIKALNRNYDCEDNKENYFESFEVTCLNGCYMFGNWNAHEFFNRFIYIEDLGSKFEHTDLLNKEEKN